MKPTPAQSSSASSTEPKPANMQIISLHDSEPASPPCPSDKEPSTPSKTNEEMDIKEKREDDVSPNPSPSKSASSEESHARPTGFGGSTDKASECAVCEYERVPHQRGRACPLCLTNMKRELGHQKVTSVLECPATKAKIKRLSDKQRPKSKTVSSGKDGKIDLEVFEALVLRLEAAANRICGAA